MDPLTVLSSCIAICQAVDRIGALAHKTSLYIHAPEEINALINETSDLKLVLTRLQTISAIFPVQDIPTLTKLLQSCSGILEQIEALIRKNLLKPAEDGVTSTIRINRLGWMQKKHHIERLRALLRDSTALLTLQLVGVNTSFHGQVAVAVPQLARLMSDLRSYQASMQGSIEATLERVENAISEVLHQVRDNDSRASNVLAQEEAIQGDIVSATNFGRTEDLECVSTVASSRSSYTSTRLGPCKCHCHVSRSSVSRSVWHGSFGSLSIMVVSTATRALSPPCCARKSCGNRKSTTLISINYLFPQWLIARALGFVFSSAPCPKVELSFPRVVPPDSNIAKSIRTGDCHLVQDLLSSGLASSADIIAPYGWNTLFLALAYQKPDVCDLLVRHGAHHMHSNALIVDMILLSAADSFLQGIQNDLLGPIQQTDPLSRLHKSVLGLTQETPLDIVQQSKSYINDMDFLGRTSLHWAACRGDLQLLELLLRSGADLDLRDHDGKAALHLAAALGYVDLVRALISSGAALEAVECLGNTPLQVAAMQGHSDTLRVLIEAGACLESTNGFQETAILSACLASQMASVQILYEYGANIEHLCYWGGPALGKAVKVNAGDIVYFLLEKGARTDFEYLDGRTLLHHAAQAADIRMLDILLGFDVRVPGCDAKDGKGYTPLDYLGLRKDRHRVEEQFQRLMVSVRRQNTIADLLVRNDVPGEDELDEEFFDAEPL